MIRKHPADILTALRIVLSIGLLFLEPLSCKFLTVYLIAGITDMVDGTLARRTGTPSKRGAYFDSFADVVFVLVSLIKLVPEYSFEIWMIVSFFIILSIKVFSAIYCILVKGEMIVCHSMLNKITGVILFAFPMAVIYI